jgi:small-conductance mechanosensitive channel
MDFMGFSTPGIMEISQGDVIFNLGVSFSILIGSIIIAKILYHFTDRFLKKRAALTESEIDDKVIVILHRPLYYIIILIGLLVALHFILPENYQESARTIISIIIIIIITKVLFGSIDIIFYDIAKKLAKRTKTALDDEAIPFLSKITKVTIVVLAGIIILDKLGFSGAVTSLVAGLGIAGFAIGFAAKDTIANILSGFFILTDRPFRRGDRIEVGDYIGEVVDIGLRTTKILTLDKNYVIIPNSKIASTEVINYTLPNVRIKLKIPIGVAYGSDPKKVKKIILETAKKCDKILDDPKPEVYFIEFGDSSLNFLLRVWVSNFRDRVKVKDFIHSQLYEKLEKEGIEIPFPCRTVYLRKEG